MTKESHKKQIVEDNSFNGMKVLVTGGAGFIGSHIVDRLIQMGSKTIILDNLSTGSVLNVNRAAELVALDIRSEEARNVVALEKPDYIFHCAAQKSVPHSVVNPYQDADENIMGFMNLITPCLKFKLKKIIFISTGGAIYGSEAPIPTPETYTPVLETPYATSKYCVEKYLEMFSRLYELKYVTIRPANVYGPRQVPQGECGVVPIFLQNIINDKPSTLFAYGDMPEGTTRDYVFVNDLVDGIMLAAEHAENEIFNLSSGEEVYMKDIYDTLLKISGASLSLIRNSERKGDVRRSALDNTKARTKLGWEPQTSLEKGLRQTFDSEKNKIRE